MGSFVTSTASVCFCICCCSLAAAAALFFRSLFFLFFFALLPSAACVVVVTPTVTAVRSCTRAPTTVTTPKLGVTNEDVSAPLLRAAAVGVWPADEAEAEEAEGDEEQADDVDDEDEEREEGGEK